MITLWRSTREVEFKILQERITKIEQVMECAAGRHVWKLATPEYCDAERSSKAYIVCKNCFTRKGRESNNGSAP